MFISRSFIRQHPKWLFIFGDNLAHQGYGGQAKECRGEPNTLGVPTKVYPRWDTKAFFTNSQFDMAKREIDLALNSIQSDVWEKIVVLPNIGCGRAELPTRAPKIWDYLRNCLKKITDR